MRFSLTSSAAAAAACLTLASCGDRQEQAHRDLRQEDYGFTAAEFLRAAGDGQTAAVNRFLEAGMNPSAADDNGVSALHAAAGQGHGYLVTLLLAKGADFSQPDRAGATPLIAAARGGDPAAARALLAAGADPDARDNGGRTALETAALAGHAALIPELAPVSKTSLDNALQLAAREGHTAAMDALLGAGAGLDTPSAEGRTPLMTAAARGHEGAVKLLCHQGADAAARTPDGKSAADLATEAAQVGSARFLTEWVADKARESGAPVPEKTPPPGEEEPVSPGLAADVGAPPAAVTAEEKPPDRLAGGRFTDTALENMAALPRIMVMEDYRLRQLPVILVDVDRGHGSASVRLPGSAAILSVKVGDPVPGTECVVEKLRRRHVYPNGDESKDLVNVSRMTLLRAATNERFQAMKDAPVFSNESAARVRFTGRDGQFEARPGDEFRVGSTLLKVTEVLPKQLTVENRLTRESVIIPSAAAPGETAPAAR